MSLPLGNYNQHQRAGYVPESITGEKGSLRGRAADEAGPVLYESMYAKAESNHGQGAEQGHDEQRDLAETFNACNRVVAARRLEEHHAGKQQFRAFAQSLYWNLRPHG